MNKYWKIILSKQQFQMILGLVAVLFCLSGAAIQTFAQVDANTLLLLRFENSLNGEQGETPTQASGVTFQAGIQGQGALFGNPNQVFYQSANNINALEGTFEFWIKPTWNGNDGQHHVIFQWNDGAGVHISKDSANNLKIIANRFGTNPGGETAFNISAWLANQWHHVAFTYSATQGQVKIYIDGQLKNTNTFSGMQPGTVSSTMQLGGLGQNRYVNAVLDDFIISSVARTPQEIAARYVSALTISSLTANPNTLQLLETWWQTPTLQAVTNIGTLSVPPSAASWTSSNPAVADFDVNRGKIVAHSAGNATLTATLNGAATNITVNVTAPVLPPLVENISPHLSTPNPNALWEMPVVIINYLPTTDGINVNSQKTGWTQSLTGLRDRINRMHIQEKYMNEDRSRFRAYSNSLVNPTLSYRVVYVVTVYEEMPQGIPAPGNAGVFLPDYEQILTRFNSENFVRSLGVKEFWVMGYHFGNIAPVESNMSSPTTGDISNSYRHNDLPVYDKTYVVYNFNFTRNVNLHGQGHQLEAILSHVNQLRDGNTQLFWDKFSGRNANGTFMQGRVGNTHFPPNAVADYDYFNQTLVASDIMNWTPAGGLTSLVNANTWHSINYPLPNNEPQPGANSIMDADYRWYLFWMQSMPGRSNVIPYNSNRMTNWWQFTGDWDRAIRSGIGLYEPANCSYTLSANSQNVASSGGTGSVTVTAGSGCKWFASNNANWTPLTSGDIGNGNGTVNFSIAPNPNGISRTTKIIIAGQIFTVNQSFSSTAASFEGDVSARPAGDGLIQSADVVQVQRFQIGLDQPNQSNEFQRADSAPFASLGDGAIQSDDVVQAQRYQIGLNLMQDAAGPLTAGGVQLLTEFDHIEKSTATDEKFWSVTKVGEPAAPREVRVESASSSAGQKVVVNIRSDTIGDESGFGFQLNFNSSVLTTPSVMVGILGSSHLCNTTVAGQITCSVNNFPGNQPESSTDQIGEIPAGNNQLLAKITFKVAMGATPEIYPLALSNVNASNDSAQATPSTVSNGTVTIAAPTAASGKISGRVLTAGGRGISKAIVTLTDSSGFIRSVRTNSFGYYRFNDVQVGESYIFNVEHKVYTFAPQIVTVNDDISDLNFAANKLLEFKY